MRDRRLYLMTLGFQQSVTHGLATWVMKESGNKMDKQPEEPVVEAKPAAAPAAPGGSNDTRISNTGDTRISNNGDKRIWN